MNFTRRSIVETLLRPREREYYLSYRIRLHGESRQPDDNAFQQIFEVSETPAGRLNFDLVRKAALIELDAAHATSQGRLPKQGGTFQGQLKGLVEGVDAPLPLEVTVGPEPYLEILM
jgi:hypothetical protein